MSSVLSSRTGGLTKYVLTKHNLALKHKPYEPITLEAVDEKHKAPKYYTRLVKGHLEDFAEPVTQSSQKKRPGDPFPKYFVCTDLTLTVQQALEILPKTLACRSR